MLQSEKIIKKLVVLCVSLLLVSCGDSSNSKQSHLNKGVQFLKENELQKARVEFKNALQIDPKFAQAYYYMGQLEEKNKQLRKALSYYKGSMELAPNDVKPKIKIAKIYVVSGVKTLIENANALLMEVMVLEPKNTEARLILAAIDYKSNKRNKSIAAIEGILLDEPGMVEAISFLSTIYSEENNLIKSCEILKKGIKYQPNDISLRMSYAKQLSLDGQKLMAEQQLLKIISISPDNYSFYLMLSNFYSKHKEYNKSEAILRKALLEDDQDINRFQGLFKFIASRGSLEKTEEELLNAMSKNPDLYELKFLLSDFYISLGDNNKSIHILEKIIIEREYRAQAVTARIKLAKIYFNEKNIQDANKLIDRVLEEFPNNNDALLIKSKISLVNKDALTAINSLRIIYKDQPKDIEIALLLANAYVMNNNIGLSDKILKQSIEINPLKQEAYLNYARFLANNKRYPEAYVFLDDAKVKFKDNYQLMNLKLKLSSFINNEEDFLAVLTQMKKTYSNNADVLIKIGQFYLVKKEYTKAIKEFEKAYRIMSAKYKPLELIVSVYLKQKNVEGAIEKLKTLTIIDDPNNNALIYQFLGKLFVKQNNYIEARINFKKALKILPQWDDPYLDLASLYVSNNGFKNAIHVYEEATRKNVKSESISIQLASLYEKTNQTNKAMHLYGKLLNSGSRSLMVKNNLALLLLKNSPNEIDLDRAKKLTKTFKSIKKPNFRDTLAWVYVKSGEYEKAVKILEEVVKDAPKVAVYKYHLAVAYYNLGDAEKAKDSLQQAINSKQIFIGLSEAKKLNKIL